MEDCLTGVVRELYIGAVGVCSRDIDVDRDACGVLYAGV